jgi:hypothetical protein
VHSTCKRSKYFTVFLNNARSENMNVAKGIWWPKRTSSLGPFHLTSEINIANM